MLPGAKAKTLKEETESIGDQKSERRGGDQGEEQMKVLLEEASRMLKSLNQRSEAPRSYRSSLIA